jgi:hypothetical protein
MDLFLVVVFSTVALTLHYPGPMSAIFGLLLLKIALSWMRSRRF